MSQSKIEFSVGDIRFVGEGDKDWVTKQLDRFINTAPSLLRKDGSSKGETWASTSTPTWKSEKPAKRTRGSWKKAKATATVTPKTKTPAPKVASVKSSGSAKELAAFIQTKKAGSNQRAKFLAAAIWLSKKGKSNPATRDVTDALKAARIPALINPSQYLNQNVKQGYLKKSGDGFMITKKGESAL